MYIKKKDSFTLQSRRAGYCTALTNFQSNSDKIMKSKIVYFLRSKVNVSWIFLQIALQSNSIRLIKKLLILLKNAWNNITWKQEV